MITFINKFVGSLSDDELTYLKDQVLEEREKRFNLKNFPQGLELLEEEKELVRAGRVIDAIKNLRGRNIPDISLKQAKDIVEAWRNNNVLPTTFPLPNSKNNSVCWTKKKAW